MTFAGLRLEASRTSACPCTSIFAAICICGSWPGSMPQVRPFPPRRSSPSSIVPRSSPCATPSMGSRTRDSSSRARARSPRMGSRARSCIIRAASATRIAITGARRAVARSRRRCARRVRFTGASSTSPGSDLLCVHRLNCIDGVPFAIERALIPCEFFPGIEDVDISDFSLYALYELRGHPVTWAVEELEPQELKARDARLLRVGALDPAPGLTCVSYDVDGHSQEFVRSVSVGGSASRLVRKRLRVPAPGVRLICHACKPLGEIFIPLGRQASNEDNRY